ncbi:N-6 DNA methylase [Bacteroidetes/Chlorobi group bacterium Naka2016]|jgi:tRNA1(Val) A37 N6-methylase TrmN6|nr:MAG: N-6 DNA methylase [Bacteroidetes/Chlorobi group bacterium Naka2016]
MGSLLKKYSIEKLKGKIYTPQNVINLMLDEIGFSGNDAIQKKILDPACGDGRFLVEIVKRIIRDVPITQVETALKNVYGWDIDPIATHQCLNNLNKLIEPYGISLDWNVSVKNSLHEIEKFGNSLFQNESDFFDIIIGNPPYIRIQNLDVYERQYLREKFSFCQRGSTDIFIAFFELCFQLLTESGIGILITPNTFLYSETASYLRKYIKSNQIVKKIINLGSIQLFDNVSTYNAITIFTKRKNEYLIYEEISTDTKRNIKIFDYASIKKFKIFNFGFQPQSTKGKKLKDICRIGVGLTTLSDKSYIFRNYEILDDKHCFVYSHYKGKIKIEKNILKPIIKGSTFKGDEGHPREFILFPYEKVNGKYKIIPEEKLKEEFPLAYEYLLSIKDILDKRDNGKPNPVAWYAFGRNQNLDESFGKKIIFSPISKKPNFILSNLEECTLYSGYFIKFNGDYELLLKELNSERMHQYILKSSRDFRGGWKAYNKKILEEFVVFL